MHLFQYLSIPCRLLKMNQETIFRLLESRNVLYKQEPIVPSSNPCSSHSYLLHASIPLRSLLTSMLNLRYVPGIWELPIADKLASVSVRVRKRALVVVEKKSSQTATRGL